MLKIQNIFKFALEIKSIIKDKATNIKVYKNIVVYAPGREERPFITKGQKENCPFCPGNEKLTPMPTKEIVEKGNWLVRSFPNKYPVFSFIGSLNYGYHEVVVETPVHKASILSFSTEHYKNVLKFYRCRIVKILSMPKIESVLFFKNYGTMAGATISHAHSQIIAMEALQEKTIEKCQQDEDFYRSKNICKTCEELNNKNLAARLFQTEHFTVQVPEISRFSYELEIIPRRHISGYEKISGSELENLVDVIKTSLGLLKSQLKKFDYNMLFSPSFKTKIFNRSKHFKINIIPRNAFLGGFELATEMFINDVTPKTAAESLRSIYLRQKVV